MGPAYFNKYILPAEDVIAEARTYASREDASPYARLLILALVEIVSRQREEERKEDTRVDESQPSANSPTGSTASGYEAVRDNDGFVLCHHGRPMACIECGEEYARRLR